jgi:hypothetical protein
MQPIRPAEVRRILEVTDALGIHRESVVIPLAREAEGGVRRVPGPKLEITAPEGEGFDAWLAGLPIVLAGVDRTGLLTIDDD